MRDYYVVVLKSNGGYVFVSSMMLLADAGKVADQLATECPTATINVEFVCKQ